MLYEQAATYVDKILKGANPARLPVEQPSKFQVTVNNKTAQALGLSISPTLAAQVDEIIDLGIQTSYSRMSLIGTKRTSNCHPPMSAFGSKADIVISECHVCL